MSGNRRITAVEKPVVTEKKCGHCKQTKTVNKFSKNTGTKDGLTSWCNACFKAYREKAKRRCKQPQRQCGGCERQLPLADFPVDKNSPSGVSSWCKKCSDVRRQLRELPKKRPKIRQGFSENYISSIIEESALLQYEIEVECEVYSRRVRQFSQGFSFAVERRKERQGALRLMLREAIMRVCNNGQPFHKRYTFGVVVFFKGDLKLELFPNFTKQRMGQP